MQFLLLCRPQKLGVYETILHFPDNLKSTNHIYLLTGTDHCSLSFLKIFSLKKTLTCFVFFIFQNICKKIKISKCLEKIILFSLRELKIAVFLVYKSNTQLIYGSSLVLSLSYFIWIIKILI